MRRLLLILVLGLAGTAPALAADRKVALARMEYERGEKFYQLGEFNKALAAYKRALAHKRYPALHFNIAQCHRQLDQYKKALFFYRLYLTEMPTASNLGEVQALIKQMITRIAAHKERERQKGRLSVLTTPPGAAVYINRVKGQPSGMSPLLVRLPAGEHLVLIRHKGFVTEHRTVTVVTGRIRVVKVALKTRIRITPREVSPPLRVVPARRVVRRRPPPRDPPRRRRIGPAVFVQTSAPQWTARPYWHRWWFWTGVVVGLAAAGGAVGSGLRMLNKQSVWDETQGADPQVKRDGIAARTATDILMGVSAVTLISTIIGAAVVGKGKKEMRGISGLVPSCGPRGCAVWLRGQF